MLHFIDFNIQPLPEAAAVYPQIIGNISTKQKAMERG